MDLGRTADLVGIEWQGSAAAHVQLRFCDERGAWSPWAQAGCCGHGPDQQESVEARSVGEPVWTGGTRVVEVRSSPEVVGVQAHMVDVSGGLGARTRAALAGSAGSLPAAQPVLESGPGQPTIIARRAWALGISHPKVAPEYGSVKLAFVHHTENPNGYSAGEVPAMLRAIYAFHRYVNGWNDIGYNFVIDRFGRIFEARAGGIDEPVVGAHAGGYNLASTGVAVLGSYMSTPISAAARSSLEHLLAWKLSLHGIPSRGRVTVKVNPAGAVYSRFPANARVSLPRIAGHRDGDSTDCPGDVLYGELPAVRQAVAHLAPTPLQVSLVFTPPSSTTPGSGEASANLPSGALSGALTLTDGTPLAGAPVQLQLRNVARRGEAVSERSVAEVVTDAQGHFELAGSFPGLSGKVSLRALCPGFGTFGATVSDPLAVDLPAVSPPAAPAPTPPAAVPPAT